MDQNDKTPALTELRALIEANVNNIEYEDALELVKKKEYAPQYRHASEALPKYKELKANLNKADGAAKAVLKYMEGAQCEAQVAISFLLSDLRHLCEHTGVSFEEELKAGEEDYQEETQELNAPRERG